MYNWNPLYLENHMQVPFYWRVGPFIGTYMISQISSKLNNLPLWLDICELFKDMITIISRLVAVDVSYREGVFPASTFSMCSESVLSGFIMVKLWSWMYSSE